MCRTNGTVEELTSQFLFKYGNKSRDSQQGETEGRCGFLQAPLAGECNQNSPDRDIVDAMHDVYLMMKIFLN